MMSNVGAGLRVQEGGSGEPVLVLLHGLGATGDVWDGWRPWLARRLLAQDQQMFPGGCLGDGRNAANEQESSGDPFHERHSFTKETTERPCQLQGSTT